MLLDPQGSAQSLETFKKRLRKAAHLLPSPLRRPSRDTLSLSRVYVCACVCVCVCACVCASCARARACCILAQVIILCVIVCVCVVCARAPHSVSRYYCIPPRACDRDRETRHRHTATHNVRCSKVQVAVRSTATCQTTRLFCVYY